MQDTYLSYKGPNEAAAPRLREDVLWNSRTSFAPLAVSIVIRRHVWLVAGAFLAVVLATAAVVFTMQPEYRAEATLLIEHNDPAVLNVAEVLSEPIYADEYNYYNTQFQLLQSREIASRVIREQGLVNGPLLKEPKGLTDNARHIVLQIAAWLSIRQGEAPDSNDLSPTFVDRYLKRLDVSPVRNTRLVKVAFEAPEPRLSAAIVNSHARSYIRSDIELRSSASKQAEAFLQRKLIDLGDRLRKSEEDLNRFRQERGIISFDDKENIAIQQLDEISRRYLEAQVERIGLETQMVQIRAHEYDSLSAVVNSPLIQQMKVDYSRLAGEYAKAGAKYKPGFPPLEESAVRLEKAQTRLREEIGSIAGSVKSAYQSAVARETKIHATLEEAKAQALKQKEDAVQFRVLSREVEANREIYDAVLQRMKETTVASDLRLSKVLVVDGPEVPTEPSAPKRAEALLISAVLGLMGGVGLAFLVESLGNTFRNHHEVEQVLNLPSLAVIPDFRRRMRVEGTLKPLLEKPTFAVSTPGSPTVAEAYRMLRATLMLMHGASSKQPRKLLITSAIASEGKTTTAINTAISLAEPGARVLLIDADLKRPRCHEFLGLGCGRGLADVLRQVTDPDDAIQATAIAGLSFLSAGSSLPSRSPAFGLTQMSDLLEHWQDQNDYIIIDSAPLLWESDTLLLSALAEGTVLIVDGSKTGRNVVQEACSRISSAGGRILGVVLNRANVTGSDYYATHYHYLRRRQLP